MFNRILLQAGEATRVDFVGDQYPEISIQNIKRERRGSSGQIAVNTLAHNSCAHGNGKNLCPLVAIKRVC